MNPTILTSTQNTLAIITLNHASKNNALTPEMIQQLKHSYLTFDKNPDIHFILLNANGNHFCAGADLNHMLKMGKAPYEENLEDAKKLVTLFHTIYSCKKITLCAVQGNTFGGGLGLIAASDIAIAAENSTFCFSEVKLGLVPATIAPFVVQRLGYQAAKYAMLTAELFDAKKALEIKLIDKVANDPLEYVRMLEKNKCDALMETKKWLNQLKGISQENVDNAADVLARVRGSEAAVFSIGRFLEQ